MLRQIGSGHPYIWNHADVRVARNLALKGLIELRDSFTKCRITDEGRVVLEELATPEHSDILADDWEQVPREADRD